MEGFTYTNIFETKGIEYIIIILFLLLLIPFWLIVNHKPVLKQALQQVQSLTAGILSIPQGIFFCKNHTWVHLEKTGDAKTGIDDFLLHVVGEVKIKAFRVAGNEIKKGDAIAELTAGDKRLTIYSPISGKITDTNPLITDNHRITGNDIYEQGWFYTIKPSDWKAETAGFWFAEEASDWIKNELHRLKDFLSTAIAEYTPEKAPVTLQEGGELNINPLADMQVEIWNDFQKEFLV